MDDVLPTNETDVAVDAAARRLLKRELTAEVSRLYGTVLASSFRNGTPVSPNALVIVLSAHLDLAEAPLVFTSEHIQELLWFGIEELCEDLGFVVPAGCVEALGAALRSATDLGILATNSDRPRVLLDALGEMKAS